MDTTKSDLTQRHLETALEAFGLPKDAGFIIWTDNAVVTSPAVVLKPRPILRRPGLGRRGLAQIASKISRLLNAPVYFDALT